jgi:uncharacterized alkaline shock family protein YloU
MGDNSFHTTVESLFKGMDSFITTKTVVGDAIHIGDTIILPLVDVSFGVAAGAFSQEKKNNGAGGMGGKITPSAVLVIQNGTTKLVNMKDGLVKLLKKDYLTHGINVSVNEDNKITIDFHVIVSYGVSISTVTDNLIETVRYKVEEFTGMEIEKINIYVEGVRVID